MSLGRILAANEHGLESNTAVSFRISRRSGYAPHYVVATSALPSLPEIFRGYGGDLVHSLDSLEAGGFEFRVFARGFITHAQHSDSLALHALKRDLGQTREGAPVGRLHFLFGLIRSRYRSELGTLLHQQQQQQQQQLGPGSEGRARHASRVASLSLLNRRGTQMVGLYEDAAAAAPAPAAAPA